MKMFTLVFVLILFSAKVFGQYGQSTGEMQAANQQAELARQQTAYAQQQWANQQAAEQQAKQQAELKILYGKDPWRRMGNGTNLNRGNGWVEFQGQVQEMVPGGIIFKGTYGAPLTVWTDVDENEHLIKSYSEEVKAEAKVKAKETAAEASAQASGRASSDASFQHPKIYGDDLFFVANFPYPAEHNRGYEKLMALKGDYFSYTNKFGQYVTVPAFDYGTPCAKIWSPEELNASKKAADEKKNAVLIRVLKSNQDAANKGDLYGLLRMGERYRDGEGVDKDLVKARVYLQKATDAGSLTASNELVNLPISALSQNEKTNAK